MGEQRFLNKVEQDIACIGWTVVAVDGDPEIGMPWWAYTIGLTRTHQHPELVIVGLPPELMQQILNNVAFMVRDGATFTTGARRMASFRATRSPFARCTAPGRGRCSARRGASTGTGRLRCSRSSTRIAMGGLSGTTVAVRRSGGSSHALTSRYATGNGSNSISWQQPCWAHRRAIMDCTDWGRSRRMFADVG